MLLWISIALFIIGIIVAIVGNKMWNDLVEGIGIGTSVVSGLALVIMCTILCVNYIGIDATVAKHKVEYEAIQYKVTSGACRDDFGLLSKEVIDEAECWNKFVAKGKELQNDFWVGVFVPDIYDQFDLVDYTTYNVKGVNNEG